jgi:hypothetical protein
MTIPSTQTSPFLTHNQGSPKRVFHAVQKRWSNWLTAVLFYPFPSIYHVNPVFPLGRGLFGPVLDGTTTDLNSVFWGYIPLIPV